MDFFWLIFLIIWIQNQKSNEPSGPEIYTLTNSIETVPVFGTLPNNSIVVGTVNGENSTYQTGDIVNGSAGQSSTLNLIDYGNTAPVAATLTNISKINHTVFGDTTFDETNYSGIGAENYISGTDAGGNQLTLLNASSTTTFGVMSSSPCYLNLQFLNARDQTLRLNLASAGSAADEAIVKYIGDFYDISSVLINTTGKNHIDIEVTTNVKNITVTGYGNNYFDLGFSDLNGNDIAPEYLIADASVSTGNNAFFLGSDYSPTATIIGSSTAGSRTWLGIRITGEKTLPTLIDVQGLIIKKASDGILDMGDNTSINFLELQTVAKEIPFSFPTLINAPTIKSINYVGGGSTDSQIFSGIDLTESPAPNESSTILEITFENRGVALSSNSNLTINTSLKLEGPETITLNTSRCIGDSGNYKQAGIDGSQIKNMTIIDSSNGLADLGMISTGGLIGALEYFDATAVVGPSKAIFDNNSLAKNAILVSGNGDTLFTIYDNQQDQPISINFGEGNNSLLASQCNGNLTVRSGNGNNSVDVGNGNNNISLGNGNDLIIFGSGASNISTGGGDDLFVISSANGGNPEKISRIKIDDIHGYDKITFNQAAINSISTKLEGNNSLAGFEKDVLRIINSTEMLSQSGLYYETIPINGVNTTYIYENTGRLSTNELLEILGIHSPVFSAEAISILIS